MLRCDDAAVNTVITFEGRRHVLQGNASLARAYRLFRTMGLHHVFVGSPVPQVTGILTRKVGLSSLHASCMHKQFPFLGCIAGVLGTLGVCLHQAGRKHGCVVP